MHYHVFIKKKIMKNNHETLKEEILRIKSLFTEERLYGNLVEQMDALDNQDNQDNQDDNETNSDGTDVTITSNTNTVDSNTVNTTTTVNDKSDDDIDINSIKNTKIKDMKKAVKSVEKTQEASDKDSFEKCKIIVKKLGKALINKKIPIETYKEFDKKHEMTFKWFNECISDNPKIESISKKVSKDIVKKFGEENLKSIGVLINKDENTSPNDKNLKSDNGEETNKEDNSKSGSNDFESKKYDVFRNSTDVGDLTQVDKNTWELESKYKLSIAGDKKTNRKPTMSTSTVEEIIKNYRNKLPKEDLDKIVKSIKSGNIEVKKDGKKTIIKIS